MKTIPVAIKTVRAWPITIGDGIIGNINRIFDFTPYSVLILMADETTSRLYGERVTRALQATGKKVLTLTVPAGEDSKSLQQAEHGYRFLLDNKVDRQGMLCILGGGVVGDLGGYLAATYLRSVDYIQLPTTLLAQVDSSIGGKAGVNFGGKKNIVGSFYQPRAIITDVSFLKTLPQEEMRNGLAEVIKYGLAMDRALFRRLMNKDNENFTSAELIEVVERCAFLKARIVKIDETERSGQRMILNFGHTIGHAIEAVNGLTGRHGEAIAVGMVVAASISEKMDMLSGGSVQQVIRVLSRFGLPTRCPEINDEKLITALHFDKKTRDGEVRWVLLDRIGHGVINCTVPDHIVQEALKEVCR
jgi:3-dehydroquinate synthase